MCRVRWAVCRSQHGKTGRVDTVSISLGLGLLRTICALCTLLAALLSGALSLLHLQLDALNAVVRALVVQLLVLGLDLLTSCIAVAATASTVGFLVNSKMRGRRCRLPELNVDLAAFLLLAVSEDGVVVLLETLLHAVVAIELDKAGPHELVCALVCAETDLGGLDLREVLLDLLLGRGVGKVAWTGQLYIRTDHATVTYRRRQ